LSRDSRLGPIGGGTSEILKEWEKNDHWSTKLRASS
jgi:hypothetical protein